MSLSGFRLAGVWFVLGFHVSRDLFCVLCLLRVGVFFFFLVSVRAVTRRIFRVLTRCYATCARKDGATFEPVLSGTNIAKHLFSFFVVMLSFFRACLTPVALLR